MPQTLLPTPPPTPRYPTQTHATLFKLAGVGALAGALLIALALIAGVLNERLQRREEAVGEITAAWGKEQQILGPLLGIPYRYRTAVLKDVTGASGTVERRQVDETSTAIAYFLPAVLTVDGDVRTETLHRGIYEAGVFRAHLSLAGRFTTPDFAALKIALSDVLWKDAFLTVAVSDLRGTRESMQVDWAGVKRPLLPGSQIPGFTTGVSAAVPFDAPMTSAANFSLSFDCNGSGGVFVAPFAMENKVTLTSNWPDPGFRGAFLPAERAVRPDGFTATWSVSYYGRSYPQQWTSREGADRFTPDTVRASVFGAEFLSILDAYRYVERSIKYGVLFLVLVFTTFFLFEVTSRTPVHPFQFLMVGSALCVFYLLLLSLSEFVGFSRAYVIAAVASTTVITGYCASFLAGGARTATIGVGLSGLYAFLYVTLRQQEYALLMGSVALFLLLAIVMYVTRKVNWYARDAGLA